LEEEEKLIETEVLKFTRSDPILRVIAGYIT